MKQVVFMLITLASACTALYKCNHLRAEETPTADRGEERIASSQYAIWIEDAAGRLVRTLYATSSTAKGGYEYRKDALPLWVSKAKPQTIPSAQVDAITGATP